MAETQNSGTKSIHYSTDFNIKTLTLVTPLQGGAINLLPFMVELNLYEDLFGSTISGEVLIQDAMGIISAYGLNGSEFLQVQLQKTSKDKTFISRNFRVYKIGKRVTGDSNDYEVFSMMFCSEEFFLSEQYRISKSMKGKEISTIIETVLKDNLKVKKPYFIEKTIGVYDFILPNKKIFETVNWLATYAQTEKSAGDFVFFENNYGYFFTSLATLYHADPYASYKFDPKNISGDLNQQVNNVTDFEVLNFFDTLAGTSNGSFSNKVIALNFLQRKANFGTFDYADHFTKNDTQLNPNPLINTYRNRFGSTMYDQPPTTSAGFESGCFRLVASNKEDKKNIDIGTTDLKDNVANDIMIERYLPNRVALMSLATYTRIKVTIPGDPNITIGKVVNFTTYKISPTVYSQGKDNATREVDPLYSGKYLVTAVRHIVNNNSYMSVIEMCKDSHLGQIAGFDNNNPALNNLINGEM